MQGLISGDRGASRLPIYEQITRGIRVRVLPNFLADQSDPEECRFLWSYTVTIENRGEETVQLIARYWQITDEAGRMQEVRGPGVVGAQPVLEPGRMEEGRGAGGVGPQRVPEPGQSFEYTSGCPLPTASGAMSGQPLEYSKL